MGEALRAEIEVADILARIMKEMEEVVRLIQRPSPAGAASGTKSRDAASSQASCEPDRG